MAGAPPAFLHLLWSVQFWCSLECYSSERSVSGGSTWLKSVDFKNTQPSAFWAKCRIIYPGFIEEHSMSKRTLTLWCEAILTSVKPLSIFPFPKSVSLCSSTYTYICHIQPNASKFHRGKAFLVRCRHVNSINPGMASSFFITSGNRDRPVKKRGTVCRSTSLIA